MAARAQALAEAETSAVGVSFVELLRLSPEDLTASFTDADYKDIQEMCKFIGVSAKGARAELQVRILDFKAKFDAGEVDMPEVVVDSPEGRNGRARAPRPGVAAAVVRTAAKKVNTDQEPGSKMEIDPRLLSAAEAQALGVGAGATSSTALGGPQAWPMPPGLPHFNFFVTRPDINTT